MFSITIVINIIIVIIKMSIQDITIIIRTKKNIKIKLNVSIQRHVNNVHIEVEIHGQLKRIIRVKCEISHNLKSKKQNGIRFFPLSYLLIIEILHFLIK